MNNRGWINKLESGLAVGHLLFGDRCSARKKFTMADASRSHEWLLTNPDQSAHAFIKRIHSLGYSIKPATGDVLSALKASGGYSLQAEIVGLVFEGCAPSLSAAKKYVSADKISNRRFTRNKLSVTIEWTLKSELNLTTIFKSKTLGIAGSLLSDSQGAIVLNDALVAAAEGLFSDNTFFAKITRPKNEPASLVSFSFSELPSVMAPVRSKDRDTKKLFLVVHNRCLENIRDWK